MGRVVLKVIDPTGADLGERVTPAPRLDTLENKRIGIVWNQKPRADVLLGYVGELLQERFPTAKFSQWRIPICTPPRAGLRERIAEEVDAVIYASGD